MATYILLRKKIFLILIFVIFLCSGIFFIFYRQQAEKESQEQIKKKEIAKIPKEEIAFLQNGNIWILLNDLTKYKIIDKEEGITVFSFSPDGKEVYWLNEKGELWKKKEEKNPAVLVSVEQDMEEAIQETWGLGEPFPYMKGKVLEFWLSPDGNYIAYASLEGHTSCCMAPPTGPVADLRIMKNDGTEKKRIEKPAGVRAEMLEVDGWLPDSQKILFHFRAPDEYTTHSAFFEVGPDGKNPKLYSEIFDFFKKGVEVQVEDITPEDLGSLGTGLGAEPVYSPTGEKIAYTRYTEEWNQEIRLMDVKTKETKTILKSEYLPFGPAPHNLTWSKEGNLLAVRETNKISIFNKNGDFVWERKFGEINPDSPGTVLVYSLLFSPENKYFTLRKGGKIIFVNIKTGEEKEFNASHEVVSKFFSKNNNLFYLLKSWKSANEGFAETGELWVIDTSTWNNYKAAENVSRAIRIP